MKINKNKKIWQQITSKKWCQGQMFTSKTGEPCEVEDSVRACSFGWLNLVYPRASDYNRARTKILVSLCDILFIMVLLRITPKD
jgi:hypothetical protein